MKIFHLFTDRVYPFHKGGLEASVFRIASMLSAIEGCKVIVHYTEVADIQCTERLENGILFVSLNKQLEDLKKPLNGYRRDNADSRITYLILKNHICKYLGSGENILMSFYLAVKGFVMQRIADDLQISHIALVRGSDYSADSFNYFRISAMRYVCENATKIVTTNEEQRRGLINMFGLCEQKISVCHNSINVEVPLIKSRKIENHYFFTDVGFSFKKGTHLLLDAFEQIIKKRIYNNFILHICGEIANGEREYWSERIQFLNENYKGYFIFDNYRNDVVNIFDNCTCYIFPSLAEGCSAALSKALMSGLPIITTKTGIVDELSEEMKDGVVIINPGDISSIITSVETMLEREECISYEFRGRSVCKYLSLDNEQKRWIEILELNQ